MTGFQITRGKLDKARRVLIYGVPGIGKTTLASQFPDPVFIDFEGSTDSYDVARLPKPQTVAALMEELAYVQAAKPCKTLVVDTADWMEDLLRQQVLAENHWKSIETPGYGKGFNVLDEQFGKILNELTKVSDAGIHAVINAHAEAKNIDLPDSLGSYMKWQPKLSKGSNKKMMEWAEMILFLNYRISIVNVDGKGAMKGKNKGQGEGQRCIFAQPNAAWEAKNRVGLPPVMPLDYGSIRAAIEGDAPAMPLEAPPVSPETPLSAPSAPGVQDIGGKPEPATRASMPAVAAPQPAPVGFAEVPESVSQLLAGTWSGAADALNLTPADITRWAASEGWFPDGTPPENLPGDFYSWLGGEGWPAFRQWAGADRGLDSIPFT